MRASSAAFDKLIAASHQIAVRVDVLFDRVTIFEGLPVVAGSITFDRNAARLARLTIDIADPLRLPLSSTNILTPFGYELAVHRGVVVPTDAGAYSLWDDDLTEELTDDTGGILTDDGGNIVGVSELIPLGVFPIQSSSVDGVTLLSSIAAEDRSRLVSDARFEDDYQIAAGTNYATAIEGLIDDGVTGLEYLFPTTTYTTPLLTFAAQEDRWDAAVKMAKSIGNEILFDGLGRCVMRPEPTFSSEPVATISDGVNMTDVSVALDRSTAYNRVIAAGRNAALDDQYRGVATDDNAESPTLYGGPFGNKPRFFYSEFIASNAQAVSAAEAILAANLGVSQSLEFGVLPDPRLECSDVVQITRSTLNIDDLHIIDSLIVGLTADSPMTGTTRTQQAT